MNFYYYYFFHYYIWIDVVILLLDKAPRQQRILMYPEQAQKVTAKMCCGDPLCLLWVPVFYFQGGLLRHRHTDIRHRLRKHTIRQTNICHPRFRKFIDRPDPLGPWNAPSGQLLGNWSGFNTCTVWWTVPTNSKSKALLA